MHSNDKMNRRLQAIQGALLGDSIGTPFEFARAEALPALAEITLPPPADYPRAHAGAPRCAWSDDGAQLLCLAETLLSGKGSLDVDLFAGRLLAWRDSGRHQAEGVVFDVGLQTDQALDRLRAGTPAHLAGGDGCGNGALMRVLPVALLCTDDALEIACRQCMPTHRPVLVQAACAGYVAMARLLLETPTLPFSHLLPWTLDAVERIARERALGGSCQDEEWSPAATKKCPLDVGRRLGRDVSGYAPLPASSRRSSSALAWPHPRNARMPATVGLHRPEATACWSCRISLTGAGALPGSMSAGVDASAITSVTGGD